MARPTRQFPAARRIPEWSQVVVRSRLVGGSSTQSQGDQSTAVEATEKITIVRVRGMGIAQIDSAALADSIMIGCGLIVSSTDAFDAGAASLPSPVDDVDAPWLWHSLLPVSAFLLAAQTGREIDGGVRWVIDGKAQRKMGPNEVLSFMWDALIIAGTPTFDAQVGVRVLGLQH